MVEAVAFWRLYIDDYQLLPDDHLIYLRPKTYWNIYKHSTYDGKTFIQGKDYTMYVNDIEYSFPDTHFYFSNQPVGQSGIYGIFASETSNIPLFVGASFDVMDTWREWNQSIRIRSKKGINPDELEYRILVDNKDLTELYDLIRYIYVDIFKPEWNKGKNELRLKVEDLYDEEIELLKNWIENGELSQYQENIKEMMFTRFNKSIKPL